MDLHAVPRVALLLIVAALALTACRSSQSTGRSAEPAASTADLPTPPGIQSQALQPLTGDALQKAQMPLADVLASLPTPRELAEPAAPDGQTPEDASLQPAPLDASPEDASLQRGVEPTTEPPLAAQHAYARGRAALQLGQREQAIAQLEQALRLAPHSAPAMRLLGQVYAASNDPIRAAQFFTDAVREDPTHARSVFILGRFALEQGDLPRAAALIHRAMQLTEAQSPRSTTLTQLAHYYLAVVLTRMGHHAAAIDQYLAFLDNPPPPRAGAGFERELIILHAQDRVAWRTIGDLYNQLNRPADARLAYDTAADLSDGSPLLDLAPRRVYTYLRLGRPDDAQRLVMQHVEQAYGSDAALDLVAYLPLRRTDARALSEQLLALAQRDDQTAAAAVVIAAAELRDDDDAQDLLDEYLQQHPGEVRIFDRLLAYWLDDTERAILRTADLMARFPRQAELYGLTVLRAADDPVALEDAFDDLSRSQRDRPMVRVLEGLAMANLGRIDAAESAFAAALERDPSLRVARLQLAKVKVAREKFDEAAELLEPIGESPDPSVVALRVRVLTETGKPAEALALLDRMLEGGADTSLVLQKARLQVTLGEPEAAERTLTDALNQDPTEEALYEALFQMYEARSPSGQALIRDADVQYRRLMRRMLGLIPDSRIGRLKRAELYAATREYGHAIALLSSLVEQDHRDLVALQQLLKALVEAQRSGQAIELIESQLQAHPRDPQLLQVAVSFYRQIGDPDRLAAAQEQLLNLLPDGEGKLLGLAGLYLSTDRAQRAADMLRAALQAGRFEDPQRLLMLLTAARLRLDQPDKVDEDFKLAFERYPDHAADLHYRWANTYAMRGDEAAYQRTLELTHEKFPDHAPTNNDLGYLWVEQHKNLDEALKMIRAAVDAEPDNPAYLDSLGWAYYKLGRFDDAVVWLRKSEAKVNEQAAVDASAGVLSTQTVVFDHLGDALYRAGNQADAYRAWRQAQRVLANLPVDADEELANLRRSLNEKIKAHRDNAPVPVADSPGLIVPDTQPLAQPQAEAAR